MLRKVHRHVTCERFENAASSRSGNGHRFIPSTKSTPIDTDRATKISVNARVKCAKSSAWLLQKLQVHSPYEMQMTSTQFDITTKNPNLPMQFLQKSFVIIKMWLVDLWFNNVPVNNYGHVETVSNIFPGQALIQAVNQYLVHILSPVTDNCPT